MSPFFRPREGCGLHHPNLVAMGVGDAVVVPVRGAGCIKAGFTGFIVKGKLLSP